MNRREERKQRRQSSVNSWEFSWFTFRARPDSSFRARRIVSELTIALVHERETINQPGAKRKPFPRSFSPFPLFPPVQFSFRLSILLHHTLLAELAADDGELAPGPQPVIARQQNDGTHLPPPFVDSPASPLSH